LAFCSLRSPTLANYILPLKWALCCKDSMDIGLRSDLSFSIGEKQPPDMQIVDIWLNSVLITYYDNSVYLPTFIGSLERELKDIENGLVNSDYIFFDHGPTTDDVIVRAKLVDDQIYINCDLDNGESFSVKLPVNVFINTYKKCIKALDVVAT
jgi:hypothetical protein